MAVSILVGDTRDRLKDIPDNSIQCVVTSPPYFQLRSYLKAEHELKRHEIGSEQTLPEYIAALVDVFRGLRRVLRNDGTVFLNLGSSYGPNKCDLMVPARVALALIDDGWILRSQIIWAKRNPMPEPVNDRPTNAHESIFLFTKQPRYFWDAEAMREPNSENTHGGLSPNNHKQWAIGQNTGKTTLGTNHDGRNMRNVWELSSEPFPESHFATFPTEIPRRCIKAGSRPGDTVLDPFGGAGTTGLVADELGRNCILVELNPDYAEIARRRIFGAAPLFASVEVA